MWPGFRKDFEAKVEYKEKESWENKRMTLILSFYISFINYGLTTKQFLLSEIYF